uniref:(northern house mosquito) hypothetical protein n=1 Tax=Culex pipiens TaxID=7175 RepID=A0A8D8ERQ1_CULPI
MIKKHMFTFRNFFGFAIHEITKTVAVLIGDVWLKIKYHNVKNIANGLWQQVLRQTGGFGSGWCCVVVIKHFYFNNLRCFYKCSSPKMSIFPRQLQLSKNYGESG